jgi:prepilin-type N-terminal cleavage/methylation domain-containing protein
MVRLMRLSNHRGFTLTEVLVVIAVVGVLAGIATLNYTSARGRAADVRVASAVRAVAAGEEAYFASHQSYTSELGRMSDVVVAGVSITIAGGNSGDLASSFRVIGSLPGAPHAYEWVSDPSPGGVNMTGTFLPPAQS